MTAREKLDELMNKPLDYKMTEKEHILMCNAREAFWTNNERFIDIFEERLNREWED